MIVLRCSKNNCLKIKWHLELAKVMTWGDSHGGVVQLQTSSRLPGRHSKAHCSHKDEENKTWIWSLFFLHILSHMAAFCKVLFTVPNTTLCTLLNFILYTVLYTTFYTVLNTKLYTVLFTLLYTTVYTNTKVIGWYDLIRKEHCLSYL